MLTLRTLGSLDLRDSSGEPVTAVLAQPKRLALLVYLAVEHRGGFCTRERLLALFWPEKSDARARNALSQSLSYLRQHLPDGAVLTRGPEDVGVDPEIIRADVGAFEDAMAEGHWSQGKELYGGDFLSGFHVGGADGFEEWADGKRRRMKTAAAGAAWSLAREQVDRGALVEAERTADQALALAWTEEAPVREFVQALARAGDRGAALSLYSRFCRRLREELGVEPSSEALALMEEIRNGDSEAGPAAESENRQARESVDSPPEREDAQEEAREQDGVREQVPVLERRGVDMAGAGSAIPRKRIWIPGAAVLLLAVLYLGFFRGSDTSPAEVGTEVVVVLPFSNRTGNLEWDYVGTAAAMRISDVLSRSGLVSAVPWQTVAGSWEMAASGNPTSRDPTVAVAEEFGAEIVMVGSFASEPRGLRFEAEIIDTDGWERIQGIEPVVASPDPDSVGPAIETVGERVIASLALRRDWPESAPYMSPMPSISVVQDYLGAYAAGADGDWARGLPLLESALRQDSSYLPARLLQAVTQLNLGNYAVTDSILDELEAVYDQMPLFERVSWQWTRAALDGDREGVYRAAKGYSERIGGNMAVYTLGFEAKRLNRPREAVEVLSRISSRTEYVGRVPGYWYHMGDALHMLGEHARELREVRRGRSFRPDYGDLLYSEVRALVGLGQVGAVRELVEEAFRKAVSTGPVVPGGPKPSGPGTVLQVAAHELRTHGYGEAFEELQGWGMELIAPELDDSGASPEARVQTMLSLYALEDWDRAGGMAQELVRANPSMMMPLACLGALAARGADRATATRISEELGVWPDPYAGANTYHRARIAALLGDKADAVRLLRQAHGEGNSFSSDLLEDPDLLPLRDYPPFQEFIRPKG